MNLFQQFSIIFIYRANKTKSETDEINETKFKFLADF
jgi:hypothetical protein